MSDDIVVDQAMFENLLSDYNLPSTELTEKPVFNMQKILKEATCKVNGEAECDRLDLVQTVFKVVIV